MKTAPHVFLFAVPALVMLSAPLHADDAAPAANTTSSSLPRVVITGTREESDYRIERPDSLGPLGTTPILDTPYSIGVLPEELIKNSQAVNFKEVSKYLPLVAYQEQQGPDILRPQTRGMQGGNFQNSRLDGMMMFVTVANAMEQFQRIEVVNGLSASLYGPANPSGMFNFVSKRPTDYELREASVTYNSDSIGTAHIDLGGHLDRNGIFGYRLNALFGEGDGYVTHSHQRRVLGDLGIDIRPWEHSVLELNYSDYSLLNRGFPGWFSYSEKRLLPPAPDPTRVGYGQPYAGIDLRTRTASARIKHDFSEQWHFLVGVLNQDGFRVINTPVNNLTSDFGAYTSSFANGFAPRFIMASDTAYLNGNFATFGWRHDLTLGTAGYKSQSYAVAKAASATSVLLGKASIADPLIFPEPPAGPPNVLANYNSSNVYQQGVNLNDAIWFDESWGVRGGVSQDWFHVDNYNSKSVATAGYQNHGVSPTGSLLFKPSPSMTTYFTYASSLQAGDTAPSGVANAGQSLQPYRSKEYELGYKARVAQIDLTAALFRIERPFATIDAAENLFRITGQQVNRGFELSAVGEIVDRLTVYGGVQLLNARMEHTPLTATNDRIYVGAPKVKGNALFEYRVAALPGLVAIFNYQFSGPRAANDTNSFYAAGYNLFDLGARYTAQMLSKPVTVRLAVDNVTDRHYWSTVAPSNLTGANTGSLLAHLGAPRTVLAAISVDL